MNGLAAIGVLFFGSELTPNERGLSWVGLCILMAAALICLTILNQKMK